VTARDSLPTDLAAAHALILAERAARLAAEARLADARAEAANAQADLTSTEAFISHLKLEIEKLRRQLYGTRSERKARRSFSSKSWKRQPPRMNWRRRRRQRGRKPCSRSSAGDLRANPSLTICRASAW
jgi:chromosome segregation ATPase